MSPPAGPCGHTGRATPTPSTPKGSRRGGTISAEHGIGAAKTGWLNLTRSAVDIDLASNTEHAWDPQGLLNPGVLIPGITGVSRATGPRGEDSVMGGGEHARRHADVWRRARASAVRAP
ncbi:FAD-linked oxidase C-terminal domain-containing protein [Streptomyces anandii]|uniref:FAD-linked oxidase C-terminal domain-containing protein n=1 Tax=Streptomyces anandii TaxID=285454 RepID=UPI0016744F2D|nr:hypothetical protein GCM10010510_67600 [Streptomyces anandii JCM 4720]